MAALTKPVLSSGPVSVGSVRLMVLPTRTAATLPCCTVGVQSVMDGLMLTVKRNCQVSVPVTLERSSAALSDAVTTSLASNVPFSANR